MTTAAVGFCPVIFFIRLVYPDALAKKTDGVVNLARNEKRVNLRAPFRVVRK